MGTYAQRESGEVDSAQGKPSSRAGTCLSAAAIDGASAERLTIAPALSQSVSQSVSLTCGTSPPWQLIVSSRLSKTTGELVCAVPRYCLRH